MRNSYEDVAVVMITRNEEQAVEKVVKDAQRYLPGCSVFVIDGSTDKTPELARKAGATVIMEPGGGFGPALHCALFSPGPEFKYLATVDADDTYPADKFPDMIRFLDSGYELVGANRLTLIPTKNMPFLNWAANITFNIFASLRCWRILRDVHSGQRVYRRELIHSYKWDFYGYAFPVDLLLWPALDNRKIKEVPIQYRERIGKSTLVRSISGRATIRRLFRRRKKICFSIH